MGMVNHMERGEGKEMNNYQWKSDITKLLRILRASLAVKRKSGWSREVSAGFIKEDIGAVSLEEKYISIMNTEGDYYCVKVNQLNLRETEELIKFLEGGG